MISAIPTLQPGDVHLWTIEAQQPGSVLADLSATLTADEQARANRFMFPADSLRFLVSRGALRTILGRYLDIPAERLKIKQPAGGKPVIECGQLEFNLSHSHNLTVIAVSQNLSVGVDIEHTARSFDLRPFLRMLAPGESASLMNVPEWARLSAFYALWTRKEAWLKATGTGLGMPLKDFEVSVPPAPPALLWVHGSHHDDAEWTIHDVSTTKAYAGALAVRGTPRRIVRLNLGATQQLTAPYPVNTVIQPLYETTGAVQH
jgi:4'-phosphopantetheinyl transferase